MKDKDDDMKNLKEFWNGRDEITFPDLKEFVSRICDRKQSVINSLHTNLIKMNDAWGADKKKLEAENAGLKKEKEHFEKKAIELASYMAGEMNRLGVEIASWKARWEKLKAEIVTHVECRQYHTHMTTKEEMTCLDRVLMKMHELESSIPADTGNGGEVPPQRNNDKPDRGDAMQQVQAGTPKPSPGKEGGAG